MVRRGGDSYRVPVGQDRVLVMQNGNPAKLMLIQKATGKVEKELVLQTRDATSVHGQFRTFA